MARSHGWYRTVTGHEVPYVEVGGRHRLLAALPRDPTATKLAAWSAANAILPRSEWRARDLSPFRCPIFDQAATGSCVGHGAVTSFIRCWQLAGNGPAVFSPCYVYAGINGGQDGGAIVGDALDQLRARGACLESTVPEGAIFRSQFPDAARADAEAAHYRVEDGYNLASFDEIGSAITQGWCVFYGIFVPAGFDSLDAGGVPPAARDTGRGGHCLANYGLKPVAAGPHRGEWGLPTDNSWGTGWGLQGTCMLVESHFDSAQRYGLQAVALRAARLDPDDPGPPGPS